MASQNGTDGRVYGGDCNLIHIADGQRQIVGSQVATMLEMTMRMNAIEDGRRSVDDGMNQQLCPGCYMIAGFHMLVALAEQNGQDMRELGASMAKAFTALANGSPIGEEIDVILDPAEDK